MSEPALKRLCMRDHIRDVLVKRILNGTYVAGTQLKELSLAHEFNVSQAPIREALRALEGTGLVTCERFRGTRVRGADLKEMRESYELRSLLEVEALKLARPYTPELLVGLGESLRAMEAAVRSGDSERYIDHALRFHRRLIESSGNRMFLSVWDSLLFEVRGRIALQRLAEAGKSLKPFIGMHRTLLARLRAQDTLGATKAVTGVLGRVSEAFGPAEDSRNGLRTGS